MAKFWISGALLSCFLLAACATTPVTGRRQLILVSDADALQLGINSYEQILSQTPLSRDRDDQRRVREIGLRIAQAAAPDDPGFEWEFNVLEDPSPNAFALPGGKVGVHTGLFKVARTDGQLAAVMAHEVAHATARHSQERLSRQIALQAPLAVLGQTVQEPELVEVAVQLATLGLVLPHTRSQESEADAIGLIYMARAGYHPAEAIDLWRNFGALGGERPPEFLSTHPSPGNRIQRLTDLQAQACVEYQRATGRAC